MIPPGSSARAGLDRRSLSCRDGVSAASMGHAASRASHIGRYNVRASATPDVAPSSTLVPPIKPGSAPNGAPPAPGPAAKPTPNPSQPLNKPVPPANAAPDARRPQLNGPPMPGGANPQRPAPPANLTYMRPMMPAAPPGGPVQPPQQGAAPGGPPSSGLVRPAPAGQAKPSLVKPAPPPRPGPASRDGPARPPGMTNLTPTMPPPGRSPNGRAPGADQLPALQRPNAPPLHVLEPLMRDDLPRTGTSKQDGSASAGQQQQQQPQKLVIIEEDDGVIDEELLSKNTKKKGHKGRKEKVTAEMKRAARKQREEKRAAKAAADRKEREEIFEVGDEGMSLEQLADIIQVDPSDIVKSLFMKGIMLSMNQVLDKNTCKVIAAEYDLLVVDKEAEGPTDKAKKRTDFVTEEDIDDLLPRPPVVTVMGHVDHGKTSLLDYIRKARVAAGEAGGITQGIGAYNASVEVDGEKRTICFLDTPGHEAFSAMRARGAQVTDIAIIIVAADDGVRPQTREAVAHAQAAEVPICVAINKVDKPGADVERAKQQLLELNLVPEEWGGTTPMVAVSAKKGTGIDDLLQMVCWMAEEKQLMVNPKKPAQGTVIEAHLDKKIGPVATLLVQAGTLKAGDLVSAGGSYGKVRSLRDDLGRPLDQAGPSIAVQMIGLDSCPVAGEEWGVAPNEAAAREAAESSLMRLKQQRLAEMTGGGSMVTLSSLATMDEEVEALQKLNLIIKGDTVGVVEAIKSALGALPQQSVTLRYLLSAPGDISISDVDLAAASGGLVVGFNLSPDVVVEEHAKRLGVKMMTYKVIYDLIDDIKAAMEGKLKNVEERIDLGTAEVKALFGTGKKKVAGCGVKSGKLQKGSQVCVKRGKKVVFEGKLSSLRRVKDLVDEVREGTECGVGCDDFLDWAVGDVIECFQMVPKTRRLEDARAATAVDMSNIA